MSLTPYTDTMQILCHCSQTFIHIYYAIHLHEVIIEPPLVPIISVPYSTCGISYSGGERDWEGCSLNTQFVAASKAEIDINSHGQPNQKTSAAQRSPYLAIYVMTKMVLGECTTEYIYSSIDIA